MNTAGHWTVVREVIHSTTDGAMILSAMPGIVRRLLDEEAWRKFEAPGAGTVEHDSFTEFMEDKPPRGLDGKRAQLLALCGSDGELTNRVKRLLSEEVEPLAEHGVNQYGDGATKSSGANTADYVVARLKRDDPILAEQVVRGEITANAAARAAGIRRPRIVLSTPERIVKSLRKHLDDATLHRLAELLRGDP